LLAPALSLLAVAGCHDPVTEVVLVLESDVVVPLEADMLQLATIAGPSAPVLNDFNAVTTQDPLFSGAFPLSMGFGSAGATRAFSVTVQLLRNAAFPATIVVSRTITNIRFVDQQTMMLTVPLFRACACQGTSCPNPGDPDCDNLASPALQPFDPALAPPSSMMSGNGIRVQPSPGPLRQTPGAP
jgi:hypothetical protein